MHSMDLFSGIGGNAYAFRSFATPALYCEVDPTAVAILCAAMDKGYIHKAPVHDNVTTLIGSPVYEAAKANRPLLVTGAAAALARAFAS
jgi:site-specific DNA-cytosine methylase